MKDILLNLSGRHVEPTDFLAIFLQYRHDTAFAGCASSSSTPLSRRSRSGLEPGVACNGRSITSEVSRTLRTATRLAHGHTSDAAQTRPTQVSVRLRYCYNLIEPPALHLNSAEKVRRCLVIRDLYLAIFLPKRVPGIIRPLHVSDSAIRNFPLWRVPKACLAPPRNTDWWL
ncbi:hypothetical protein JOE34_002634 [Pseudomonas sp. PvP028]|nr:hypothetical protein [Pseudomonas sp. PvP028]